jgi:DNA-binding NarL/FixJ family response regulator
MVYCILMRIQLADHHPQALWALKTTLQEKPEFEVTGEASNSEDLLEQVKLNNPDLILLDGELPDQPIFELITELHECASRPIVVGMSSKPEYSMMLLKAGADAFVSKGDQPGWLIETLTRFEKRSRKLTM